MSGWPPVAHVPVPPETEVPTFLSRRSASGTMTVHSDEVGVVSGGGGQGDGLWRVFRTEQKMDG